MPPKESCYQGDDWAGLCMFIAPKGLPLSYTRGQHDTSDTLPATTSSRVKKGIHIPWMASMLALTWSMSSDSSCRCMVAPSLVSSTSSMLCSISAAQWVCRALGDSCHGQCMRMMCHLPACASVSAVQSSHPDVAMREQTSWDVGSSRDTLWGNSDRS